MKNIFKRIMILSLVLFLFNNFQISAKTGDKTGTALYTDIVAYINHYAIPSYAVDGQSCVVAEDLRNFGFDVLWNDANRSLTVTRNNNTWINEQYVSKEAAGGTVYADTLETDIVVYANGVQISSYAINGYTMIPMEQLTCFGEVYWIEGERALKLWIDGMQIREEMQYVPQYVAPVYTEYAFDYYVDNSYIYTSTVYVTPTGKRYHYRSSCAGKNARGTTIEKAKNSGYTPCKKCV